MKKILLFLIILFISMTFVSAKEFTYNENTMQIQEIEISISDKIENTTQWIEDAINENKNAEHISVLYWLRGMLYKQNKDYSNALQDFNTALKYNPNALKFLKSLISVKMEIKDYDGALLDANKIITLEPKLSQNYIDRAHIYYELHQYNKAINDYTKAIVVKPKNPKAFEMRGMIEILINQKEKGFQDLGYAKQQYYELEMYDEYRNITKFINNLKEKKYKKNYNYNSNYNRVQPIIYENNYETQKQLQDINRNLENINRTLLFDL